MPKPTPESKPRPTPSTAMVFAAGLGQRMRPITDAIPKPLVKVAGRTLIDHCLDRLAEDGVGKAIVNVHWLADQIEAHLATRVAPQIVISDERARLLDQGGGIKKALPLIGDAPFFICNTDALWIEGPRSELDRLARSSSIRSGWTRCCSSPQAAGAVGVDWPGDFTMDPLRPIDEARPAPRRAVRLRRRRHHQAATVRTVIAEDVFRLAPFFFRAAEQGRLFGVRLDGLWLHVGRPESIAEAERAIDRSRL